MFDSHAHLIAADASRYPPKPLSGSLRPGDLDDPVTAERLLRLMDENQVARACVVQRAHVYGYDNSYVVDAAERYPDRLCAVVAIDGQAVDVADQIRFWIRERGAVGIRIAAVKPDPTETAWFTGAGIKSVWRMAAALEVSICVHVFRPQRAVILGGLPQLLTENPTVPVVIDHLSNMAEEAGGPDFGIDPLLTRIASFPNAYLKFSTINLSRLAAHTIPAPQVIERVVALFGAARVMWGSDIAQTKGAYPDMVKMAHAAVGSLPASSRSDLLETTAALVYAGP